MEYLTYFILTTLLSTLFAIAGLGSAVALVPSLHMVGLSFDLARVSGLFINSVTTITSSLLNLKKKLFDMNFVAPLVVSSALFALLGAQISLMVEVNTVKKIFGVTLFIIASMIFFSKSQAIKR